MSEMVNIGYDIEAHSLAIMMKLGRGPECWEWSRTLHEFGLDVPHYVKRRRIEQSREWLRKIDLHRM